MCLVLMIVGAAAANFRPVASTCTAHARLCDSYIKIPEPVNADAGAILVSIVDYLSAESAGRETMSIVLVSMRTSMLKGLVCLKPESESRSRVV